MSDQVENEGCVMCTMGRQVWWLYGYRVAPGAKMVTNTTRQKSTSWVVDRVQEKPVCSLFAKPNPWDGVPILDIAWLKYVIVNSPVLLKELSVKVWMSVVTFF